MSKVLVVAAHPDDEVLGCGGTIARMAEEGHDISTLILGEGVTSRDEKRNREKRSEELELLGNERRKASEILGVKQCFSCDFPDNRFDSVPLLDIVKAVDRVKCEVEPEIVFTHFANDLNIDHTVTCRAVMTATRPMVGETVRELYAFDILSSTEWNFPLSFDPDTYFSIEKTIDKKVAAMEAYMSELCDFPHPRSLEGIRLSASFWGMRTGLKAAEPFKTLRVLR